MPTLKDADEFFSSHLLKEKYFNFSDAERSSAVATAGMDINAVRNSGDIPQEYQDNFDAAIFEQAIYLLLNPHILSGTTDAENASIISPRAKMLLSGIPESEENENENSTDSEPSPELPPVSLRINRG